MGGRKGLLGSSYNPPASSLREERERERERGREGERVECL